MSIPDEQRFPSIEEFQGWYNLGFERPDGVPVLHSRDEVPPFEHGAFLHMYLSEREWFEEQLVPTSVLGPFDPVLDPPMYIISDADDRTLRVLPDFDYLTLDIIRRIQQEFLGRYPFWRVVLWADAPSCSILVYPEAIRFGNLPLSVNPDQALHEMATQAIALREARLRPARKQAAFVQRRLRDAVRAIGDKSFYPIGALDNDGRERDRLAVFFLINRERDWAIAVDVPGVNDDECPRGRYEFDVDASGNFTGDRSDLPPAAFRVISLCPRADYRGPLTISDRETGESYVYELKSADIASE